MHVKKMMAMYSICGLSLCAEPAQAQLSLNTKADTILKKESDALKELIKLNMQQQAQLVMGKGTKLTKKPPASVAKSTSLIKEQLSNFYGLLESNNRERKRRDGVNKILNNFSNEFTPINGLEVVDVSEDSTNNYSLTLSQTKPNGTLKPIKTGILLEVQDDNNDGKYQWKEMKKLIIVEETPVSSDAHKFTVIEANNVSQDSLKFNVVEHEGFVHNGKAYSLGRPSKNEVQGEDFNKRMKKFFPKLGY